MQLDLFHLTQTGTFDDLVHLLVGKPQTAVMLFLAQCFELVRSKINDQQTPPLAQNASAFCHGQRRVIEIVQHLVHGHQISSAFLERQRTDIGMAHRTIAQPGIFQIGAGDIEHGVVDIDADTALHTVSEQFQHPACPNADINHQIEWPVPGQLAHFSLDLVVGQVELADPVPILGDTFKIGLCGFGTCFLGAFQSGNVPRDDRVIGRHHVIDQFSQTSPATAIGQAIEDIGPFRQAFGQPGVGQQFEMPAHPRLALAQNIDQFGHGEFPARKHDHHPQSGRLGQSLKLGDDAVHEKPVLGCALSLAFSRIIAKFKHQYVFGILELSKVRKDVLVIGAGLAGIAAAWELRKRGLNVSVLDAREGPGLETSFANAGALTPSEPEPWNAPGVHWDLIKSLFDPHAAMKLRLAPLPGLIGWGLRFLRNSTRKRHLAASKANFALSRYSLGRTQATRDELGIEFDNIQAGTLKVFQSETRMKAAATAAELLRADGLEYKVLSRAETIEQEPQLAPISDRIAGAVLYPMDESGDAHAFTCALARKAEEAGVAFEWNTRVTGLMDRAGEIIGVYTEDEEIEVDAIVIASGQASWKLMLPLGLHLPVRPVKGYSLTLDMSGLNARPGLPVVDDAMHAIVTPLGDRLRVAGTAEIAGEDAELTPERIDNLKRLLLVLYPEIAPQVLDGEIKPWTGLRPMSADGKPFIGQTRAKGLWLNTGHGHLGWTQAMGSGALLADMIAEQQTAIDPAPYAADRI